MNTFSENLAKALKEFETLTNAQAGVLKNKGKEKGLAQLKVAFKNGKTLEQRAADYDRLIDTALTSKVTPDQAKKLAQAVEVGYAKFSEGLKKNRDEFDKLGKEFGPADAKVKAGYEIFAKRMDQIRHESKLKRDHKIDGCKQIITGESLKGDAKVVSSIKTAYLGIKGGADDTEILIKKFLTEPTKANAIQVLSNDKGPRSMGVGVTTWKAVLKANPTLAERLAAAGGGDPVHILDPVYDITQNKGGPFWEGQLKFNTDGWEGRVKTQLQELHKVVGHLRRSADAMKKLVG